MLQLAVPANQLEASHGQVKNLIFEVNMLDFSAARTQNMIELSLSRQREDAIVGVGEGAQIFDSLLSLFQRVLFIEGVRDIFEITMM